ncbi:hypothetical protein HPB49_018484 [Dermacentor silvarum]|uniref:Uncharacterized protein n=1 Tax=Dermacentor silvarum TaxID=543639 RepID=A0ACB8DFA5_DERSI|nr:hypothetical protein HPB49_018484 [Dermacentor silvarum]
MTSDQPSHLSTSRPLHFQHQNQVTLANTVKGEPFPLENSISIQETTLKIPVCIGITHHIYQQEQDNPEIAHLKRENAILRDLVTKLTQEPLPLVKKPPHLPPRRREPCKMEPRARSALKLDMLISLQTTVSTFQHALDSIQSALIGIVQRVTNLENHILEPPNQSAPAFTRNNRYLINTYANIPTTRMLSNFKKPITPPPRSLVIKPSIPLTLFAGPKDRAKYRFLTLFKKALHVAGTHPILIGGDFNLTHAGWGYVRPEAAARNLWQDYHDLGLTLITDPSFCTRLGTSTTRDSTPDLTFIKHINNAHWTNIHQDLGSDHYILVISLPQLAAAPAPTKECAISDWDAFRKIRIDAASAEGIAGINTWMQALRTDVQTATRVALVLVGAAVCVSSENRYGAQAAAGGGFAGPGFTGGAGAEGGAGGPSFPPQPYSFGYDSTDEFGTQLFHKEQGDASNAKTGSYGYRDANGLYRTVTYVADANGFRATVDTNEPGTAPGASADAVFNAKPVAAPAAAPGAGKVTPGRYVGARPGGAYGTTAAAGAAGGPWAG